jgi:hypothetical protein
MADCQVESPVHLETQSDTIETFHLEKQSDATFEDQQTLKNILYQNGENTRLALIIFGISTNTYAEIAWAIVCRVVILGSVAVSVWLMVLTLMSSEWKLLGGVIAMLIKVVMTAIGVYEFTVEIGVSLNTGYNITEDGVNIWKQSLSDMYIPMGLIFSPLLAAISGAISTFFLPGPVGGSYLYFVLAIFLTSWVLAAYTSVVLWFISTCSQRSSVYLSHLETLLAAHKLTVTDYHNVLEKVATISQSCRWGVSYLLPVVLIDTIGGICMVIFASKNWFDGDDDTSGSVAEYVVLASTLIWFLLTLIVADLTFLAVLLLRLANVNDQFKRFARLVVAYSSSGQYQEINSTSKIATFGLSAMDRHEILALCAWEPIGMEIFGTRLGRAAIMNRLVGLCVGLLIAVIKFLLTGLVGP